MKFYYILNMVDFKENYEAWSIGFLFRKLGLELILIVMLNIYCV